MTDIQARCSTEARTCVGHPFNPPYLVPFVEVVGGQHTDPEVVDWVELCSAMQGVLGLLSGSDMNEGLHHE